MRAFFIVYPTLCGFFSRPLSFDVHCVDVLCDHKLRRRAQVQMKVERGAKPLLPSGPRGCARAVWALAPVSSDITAKRWAMYLSNRLIDRISSVACGASVSRRAHKPDNKRHSPANSTEYAQKATRNEHKGNDTGAAARTTRDALAVAARFPATPATARHHENVFCEIRSDGIRNNDATEIRARPGGAETADLRAAAAFVCGGRTVDAAQPAFTVVQ